MNIDYSVYRSKGKMRCVNAYKDDYDKHRINKLVMGTISQTIISAYNNMNDDILNDMIETKEEPFNIKNEIMVVNAIKSKKKMKSKKIIELENKIKQEQKKEREKDNNDFSLIYKLLDENFLVDYLDLIDINKINSREEWLNITLAYKNAGGDFEDYKKWNMKSKHYEEKGVIDLWNTYDINNIECTMGTIKHYANIHNEKKYKQLKKNIKNVYEIADNKTETKIAKTYYGFNKNNIYSYNKQLYIFLPKYKKWILFDKSETDFLRNDIYKFLNKLLKNIILFFSKISNKYQQVIDNADDDNVDIVSISNDLENIKKYLNQIITSHLLICKTMWLNNITKEVCCLLFHKGVNNDDIFDKKPYLFAFKNVVFDLKTGNELDFDKEMYITMNTGKDFIKPTENQLDTIDRLFKQILPNEDVRDCYLSLMFSALTGIRLEKFIIANGSGRNGKGLINELLQNLMGNYSYKLPKQVLSEKVNMMGACPQIANMNNKRFIITSEPEEGRELQMDTIKQLTGDDTLNARGLYQKDCRVNLNMTLLLEANLKPNINGRIDNSVMSRIVDIAFVNHFTDDDNLVDEKNGIYKADLSYKQDVFKDNHYSALFMYILQKARKEFYMPECVRNRSKKYVMNSDGFYGWIEENYTITKKNDDIVKLKDLYSYYKESNMYNNSTKKDKKLLNFKKFSEDIKYHIVLKNMYKDNDTRINGIKIKGKRLHGLLLKEFENSDSDSD